MWANNKVDRRDGTFWVFSSLGHKTGALSVTCTLKREAEFDLAAIAHLLRWPNGIVLRHDSSQEVKTATFFRYRPSVTNNGYLFNAYRIFQNAITPLPRGVRNGNA